MCAVPQWTFEYAIESDRGYPAFVAECAEWRRRRPDAWLTAAGDEVRVKVPGQAPTREEAETTARGELAAVFRSDRYQLAARNTSPAVSETFQRRGR